MLTTAFLGLLLAAAPPPDAAARQKLQAEFGQALAAREKKDLPAFLAHAEAAANLAPRSVTARLVLARARALNGRAAEALKVLDGLAAQGLWLDLRAEPDLASLNGTAFEALLARMEEAKKPEGRSEVAFRLPERDFVPEGIAHDAKTGAFLVGSVHLRKIVRVATDGTVTDFVEPGQNGLGSVLGIAADSAHRVLWACSSALPQGRDYRPQDEGRTRLHAFDLDSGRTLRSLEPPKAEGPRTLNDLTLAGDGTVYVSDPASSALYVLRPGGPALEVLLPPGVLASPQGLALSADEKSLYVADYALGIVRVDLVRRQAVVLDVPDTLALGGVDGLTRNGDDLLAIQNGLEPHRVLRLRLQGDRVAEARVVQRAHPLFDEPTLGVVVGGKLHYVANSQWRRFEEDGTIWPRERLDPPTILRAPLD